VTQDEAVEILARELYVDDTAQRTGWSTQRARHRWYVPGRDGGVALADEEHDWYRGKARRIADSLAQSDIELGEAGDQ